MAQTTDQAVMCSTSEHEFLCDKEPVKRPRVCMPRQLFSLSSLPPPFLVFSSVSNAWAKGHTRLYRVCYICPVIVQLIMSC